MDAAERRIAEIKTDVSLLKDATEEARKALSEYELQLREAYDKLSSTYKANWKDPSSSTCLWKKSFEDIDEATKKFERSYQKITEAHEKTQNDLKFFKRTVFDTDEEAYYCARRELWAKEDEADRLYFDAKDILADYYLRIYKDAIGEFRVACDSLNQSRIHLHSCKTDVEAKESNPNYQFKVDKLEEATKRAQEYFDEKKEEVTFLRAKLQEYFKTGKSIANDMHSTAVHKEQESKLALKFYTESYEAQGETNYPSYCQLYRESNDRYSRNAERSKRTLDHWKKMQLEFQQSDLHSVIKCFRELGVGK